MEDPGEYNWLTKWLSEDEAWSDKFPYSVVLFAWSGDVPTWNHPQGTCLSMMRLRIFTKRLPTSDQKLEESIH